MALFVVVPLLARGLRGGDGWGRLPDLPDTGIAP